MCSKGVLKQPWIYRSRDCILKEGKLAWPIIIWAGILEGFREVKGMGFPCRSLRNPGIQIHQLLTSQTSRGTSLSFSKKPYHPQNSQLPATLLGTLLRKNDALKRSGRFPLWSLLDTTVRTSKRVETLKLNTKTCENYDRPRPSSLGAKWFRYRVSIHHFPRGLIGTPTGRCWCICLSPGYPYRPIGDCYMRSA